MNFPRILFVVNRLDYGGAEVYALSIANTLAQKGYTVHIASSGGSLVPKLHSQITHHTLPTDKKSFPDLIKTSLMLRSIIQHNAIQIIHANSVLTAMSSKIASLLTPAKIITTVHSWGTNKTRLSAWIVNMSSHKVVSVSQSTAHDYIIHGLNTLKVVVIHNGIDESRFEKNRSEIRQKIRTTLNISETVPVIINVARMEEKRKGHQYLIKAFKQVVQRCEGAYLIFVGDGHLRQELEALCCGKNLSSPQEEDLLDVSKQVLFLGTRGDVPELLMASDIFCLMSEWEGLPLVIAEAMICGLPVVASRVSGIPEMVVEGATGFLSDPIQIDEIAQNLSLLIHNKELYQKMSHQAQLRAHQMFTLNHMITCLEQLYQDVV